VQRCACVGINNSEAQSYVSSSNLKWFTSNRITNQRRMINQRTITESSKIFYCVEVLVLPKMSVMHKWLVAYNHWTGLVDWTRYYYKKHTIGWLQLVANIHIAGLVYYCSFNTACSSKIIHNQCNNLVTQVLIDNQNVKFNVLVKFSYS